MSHLCVEHCGRNARHWEEAHGRLINGYCCEHWATFNDPCNHGMWSP